MQDIKLGKEDLMDGHKYAFEEINEIYDYCMIFDGFKNMWGEEATLLYHGHTLPGNYKSLLDNGAMIICLDREEMTGEVIYDE